LPAQGADPIKVGVSDVEPGLDRLLAPAEVEHLDRFHIRPEDEEASVEPLGRPFELEPA